LTGYALQCCETVNENECFCPVPMVVPHHFCHALVLVSALAEVSCQHRCDSYNSANYCYSEVNASTDCAALCC